MTTVYEFKLPRGYLDENGGLHIKGEMRLATAGDEISTMRDPRVLSNQEYFTIVLLSKVVTELEGIEVINANLIERLYTADFAYLQDMYNRINDIDPPVIQAICPRCGEIFTVPLYSKQET